jgi:Ran GTPase-activating protein (RanGAP) involved in mRNA processing and transport
MGDSVALKLRLGTTVIDLDLGYRVLSGENVQQLKAVLRQNTNLESLNLRSSRLGSAGLAEIVQVLYCNTSIMSLGLRNNGLHDIESANVLRELIRRNKTITSLCIAHNAFGHNAVAVRSIADGVRSNTTLQKLDLRWCRLDDLGIAILGNAIVIRNASILELNLSCNEITSVGVRALVEGSMGAMKALTKLSLWGNPIRSEGAIIMADVLRNSTMPNLKRLDLGRCGIDDDGFVALVSALEQNTTLQILDFKYNRFGERGFMALAESLPNIKGLQQIDFSVNESTQSTTVPLLLKGFRKNTSLLEVVIFGCGRVDYLQEIKFLGQRNRITPLLTDASLWLGIWPRALAKVATEPDVLFYVLCNKPKLVGSGGRDDE